MLMLLLISFAACGRVHARVSGAILAETGAVQT